MVQRQFNTKTKEQEEHQEFINLDESKCGGIGKEHEEHWVFLTLAKVLEEGGGLYHCDTVLSRVSYRILSWGREQDGSRMIVVCESVRAY